MEEIVYDIPISEVAKLLDKSDRQVRRYVKEKQLKVRSVRVGGHKRLMFNRDDILSFRERVSAGAPQKERAQAEVIEGQVVEGDDGARQIEDAEAAAMESEMPPAVKYVIDALTSEIKELKKESKELHYQLEQRSGQVGFLQGKVEILQEELKMLAPAQKEEDAKKPWYKRIFGG